MADTAAGGATKSSAKSAKSDAQVLTAHCGLVRMHARMHAQSMCTLMMPVLSRTRGGAHTQKFYKKKPDPEGAKLIEQGEEALLPRVDDVDLVEAHVVHDLLSLLQLALGALDEARRGAHGVVVPRSAEGPPELGNLPRRLVDRYDVARRDLLLRQGVDHLRAQVVDRLHVRRAERQPPLLLHPFLLLVAGGEGRVDLYLDDLALHDLRLLEDLDADALPQGLRQRLGL